MMDHRAEAVMLDFTEAAVGVRYQIDGLWHNYESRDRATGDAMLQVFKQVAALKPNERRAKQDGTFAVEFNGAKRKCQFTSQGVPTGERAVIQMADVVDRMWTFEELGMRPKLDEQVRADLGRPNGFVLY